MKYVIAFVQPFVASRVADALHEVAGVTGATFTDVRGFGSGRRNDPRHDHQDPEAIMGTTPKVRVEVMIRDALETEVVQAIRTAAHTGNRGDGKVFVTALTRAVRIRTGEDVRHGADDSGQSVV